MEDVIRVTIGYVKDNKIRLNLYKGFIEAFTDADWDCVDECVGIDPMFDRAAEEGGYIEEEE